VLLLFLIVELTETLLRRV